MATLLIDRIKNTIFKTILTVEVDYHAGGFFIRKTASYFVFTSGYEAIQFEREEGLHPYDNNYEILLSQIIKEKKGTNYAVTQPNRDVNILKLQNVQEEILCMPSVFLENVNGGYLTELVIDCKRTSIKNIYSSVFKF